MSLLKDLSELVNADVISIEIADKIKSYYQHKKKSSTNQLFIIFGVLGATLVGLGIILIIAHNWDQLSKTIKNLFAFLPLLIGQVLCGWTLIKKQTSVAWREASSVFLFFSVGSSIVLISQIYNIAGSPSSFLVTWMTLCLPLVYIMHSSVTSLLYIIGITYYSVIVGYVVLPLKQPILYWPLLLLVLPHYYQLYKTKLQKSLMVLHNWLIPISLIYSLGTFAKSVEELIVIAYMSLFALLYLIGNLIFFKQQKLINNGYEILGSMGTMIYMMILSFESFWKSLNDKDYQAGEIIKSSEFLISTIITLLALGLIYKQYKYQKTRQIKPIELVFILVVIAFIINWLPFESSSLISAISINFFILFIGISTIRAGAKQGNLGTLNYGLLIITVLIICRFFDTDLNFIIRGILFMVVGFGFFAANYWMVKKRIT